MILLTLNLLLASAQLDTTIYNDSILCAPLGITLKALKPIKYEPVIKQRQLSFSIFPNPTSDLTNVQLSLIPDRDLTFVVTDVLGRELYRDSRFMNTNRHTINLKAWENGLYLLRIMNGNSVIYYHQIHVLK
jgi:Secretion system C-terminal sorting domain